MGRRHRRGVVGVGLVGAVIAGSVCLGGAGAATAAGSCSPVERMVWTGDDGATRRDVAVGSLGDPSPVIASAGVSTADSDPAVSPDGQHVAWVGLDDITHRFVVYVANADGSNAHAADAASDAASAVRDLAAGSVDVGLPPAWSPDSARLAWATHDGTAIRVAAIDGSQTLSLGVGGSGLTDPRWSPDGTRLAWRKVVAFNSTELLVAPVADLAAGDVLVADVASVAPADLVTDWPGSAGFTTVFGWNPDGTALAYLRFVPGSMNQSAEVALVKLDGSVTSLSDPILLFGVIGTDEPRFAPDGTRLAWSMVVRVQGGLLGEWDDYGRTVLASTDGSTRSTISERDAAWSADGSRLVSSSWNLMTAVAGEAASGAVSIRNSGGVVLTTLAGPAEVDPHFRVDLEPAWSPDATKVAFESQRWVVEPDPSALSGSHLYDTEDDLVVRSADGSGAVTVLGPGSMPAWSRGGTAVGSAFDGRMRQNPLSAPLPAEVRAYPIDGSAPTVFTGPVQDVRARPGWTSTASADLSVAVVAPSAVTLGQAMAVDITVTNPGPCDAADVYVAGTWPADRPATFTPDAGWVSNGNWRIPHLAAGASAHLHISATITGAGDVIGANPAVWSELTDPNRSNNAAAWSTTVVGAPTTTGPTSTTPPPAAAVAARPAFTG